MPNDVTMFVHPTASARTGVALDWLVSQPQPAEVLVVGETLDGPRDLILRGASRDGAVMGLRRTTLPLLASELAAGPLFEAGLAVGGVLSRDAIVARAVMGLGPSELGRFGSVADTPGFVRAIGRALEEARMAGLESTDLAAVDEELARLASAVAAEWTAAGLADRSRTLEAVITALATPGFRHYLLDHPLLLLDLRVWTPREAELVGALIARSPETLITISAADARTLAMLDGFTGLSAESDVFPPKTEESDPPRAIDRLHRHLFKAAPDETTPDDTLTIFSAPGEGRECVEIARRLLSLTAAGTRFDRCAILLRQPEDYRPHVEEALRRAEIPSYFARGVRRPDPTGRAFLALLRCRAEDYSALRFAEYLSIGEVPDATEEGAPPAAADPETRWVAPDVDGAGDLAARLEADTPDGQLELVLGDASRAATSDGEAPGGETPGEAPRETRGEEASEAPPNEAVPGRTLRVPRRWERLLVEASVVGGLDRWARRLDGLRAELELRRSGLVALDADDPRIERIDVNLVNLGYLRDYVLPLLDDLAALPEEASWAEWLDALGALATRGLRRPKTVLSLLAGLAPMGPIGPVSLSEVLRAISSRLLEVTTSPEGPRYGRVFVGPIDAARGLAFDVVFVPGMAERVFPAKISEDPILLDPIRDTLNRSARAAGPRSLGTNLDRVAAERLALELAVGAASERVVLSYPRIEADKARPRVPSFYALEAVRAAEGRLPRFEDLAKRAEDVSDARIGWPAPKVAELAIDEAEYDLAVLDDLGLRGDEAVRATGHLLHSNPHLARALRFRAYRWEVSGWTWADGLIDLSEGAAAALDRQSPDARAFSATALQHFAACPYRFYLQALQRLHPREEPIGIEALDPLQRGSLVHQVQFELLTRLQTESSPAEPLLPARPENLDRLQQTLDEVLDTVAADFRDTLVPAIDRVWDDGIESIRADLREWLYRESLSGTPFEPWRFELSFGLPADPDRDDRSQPEPVDLGIGLRLRGAIDLIERSPNGVLRVTDHKTGKHRAKRDAIIQGGELLQPVLYAMAAQKLFPDTHVESGRLYYCTTAGGYRTHEVPLNEHTIQAARVLSEVVREAFDAGRFPAIPGPGTCRWCDYRTVCGPDEERRVRRKPKPVDLKRLRDYQ